MQCAPSCVGVSRVKFSHKGACAATKSVFFHRLSPFRIHRPSPLHHNHSLASTARLNQARDTFQTIQCRPTAVHNMGSQPSSTSSLIQVPDADAWGWQCQLAYEKSGSDDVIVLSAKRTQRRAQSLMRANLRRTIAALSSDYPKRFATPFNGM
jgi:hypothetical protein